MEIFLKNENKIKNIKIYKNFCLLFYFLIFFSIINKSVAFNFTFNYPRAITLSTGNILIIHKTGIDIYDSALTTLIKNVKNFSDSEIISDENVLSRVSISKFNKSENDIIISIIINKTYIFNHDGEKLYEESENDIFNNVTSSFYDLLPLKKNNNLYSYMLGFIMKKEISLYFFEYNNTNKQNNLKKNLPLIPNNYETSFDFKSEYGFTCQLMYSLINKETIACFYNNHNSISEVFIDPNSYEINYSNQTKLSLSYIQYMKSVVSSNKNKCFIYTVSYNGESIITIYSLENYINNNINNNT